MRQRLAVALCAAPVLLFGLAAQAQPKGTWTSKAFEEAAGPPVQAIETFINSECRPSGLDGLQAFAIQSGHDQRFNLHLYCRKDGAAGARYKVSLVTFEKAKFSEPVARLVEQPNVRIGPFYFGKTGEGDGMLVIEKLP